ncbi:MAG: putative response regulator in two-component reguatory system, sigma54 dependent transcriptional [Symbiobacteriaceae bacterium]|nr:putative response regulator in two-component reguatory system, sigma54 dependent transcriptional [Symbiobacteriaceae bacterium]
MRQLLIVDDEPNMAWLFEQSFGREFQVAAARSGTEALAHLERAGADLIMLDLCMPGMDGMAVLKEVKRRWPAIPVVMMTAYATVKTAVEAIKAGAADYVLKPFDLDELRRVMTGALPPEPASVAPPRPAGMLGESPAMLEVFRKLARVAPTDACVLILGETGTGKELVARAIHAGSSRAARPFVAFNCAAVPENLLESELFGYEKGAFTDARARKPGRFELAAGGTLLLDEVGDMPLPLQAKLLRVLESRAVEPLGAIRPLPVDVRVLAATHRDLREMVRQGKFREDLYFRLAVVPVGLPPLRERPGDVAVLAAHFLRTLSEKHGKAFAGFSPGALAVLTGYGWPGNVRELRNLVEQVVVLWDGPVVELEHLPSLGVDAPGARLAPASLKVMKAGYEQQRIEEALLACGGNRTRAAQVLGISRRALQMKLKALEDAE